MSSPDAAQKLEQARALIEDAKAVFEIRSSADARELQELKKKLADKEHELRTKERELHQKSQELQRKDSELARKSELLEKSKEPIKAFIEKELAQSFKAVTEAKTAHSQSPSKYTAGFVELAKGSHAENEEMFKRLAQAVGVKFEPLKEEFKQELGDEAVTKDVERPPISRRITPREPYHLSRYANKSKGLERRDSATVVQ